MDLGNLLESGHELRQDNVVSAVEQNSDEIGLFLAQGARGDIGSVIQQAGGNGNFFTGFGREAIAKTAKYLMYGGDGQASMFGDILEGNRHSVKISQ